MLSKLRSLFSPFLFFYFLAFLLRIFASIYAVYLFDRVELVTPLTNVKRLKEALFLEEIGHSPYDGSAFHLPPLVLSIFRIPAMTSVGAFNILIDFLIAWLLFKITILYNQTSEASTDRTSPPPKVMPHLVALFYLFIPFSWAPAVAQSLGTLENLLVISSLYYALKKNLLLSVVTITIAVYISLYPIQLLIPLMFILSPHFEKKIVMLLFTACMGMLVLYSYQAYSSWDWVFASYGFTLQVIDLTPNIGLFWYFFLEVFDHFRTFFCCVLQLNCFLYTAPLSICFRKRPVLLFWLLFTYYTTLKSYPSVSDLAVEFGLLPLFYPILMEFLHRFVIIAQFYIYCGIVMPILWYAWLYQGSGNANFYYGCTLALGLAQIWLLIEVTHLAQERAYKFKHKLAPFVSQQKVE